MATEKDCDMNAMRPWVVIACTLFICATVVAVAWIRLPVATARIEARVEKHEQRMDKVETRIKAVEDRIEARRVQ